MRKFLIRWWYTENYADVLHDRLISTWHDGEEDVIAALDRAARMDSMRKVFLQQVDEAFRHAWEYSE